MNIIIYLVCKTADDFFWEILKFIIVFFFGFGGVSFIWVFIMENFYKF